MDSWAILFIQRAHANTEVQYHLNGKWALIFSKKTQHVLKTSVRTIRINHGMKAWISKNGITKRQNTWNNPEKLNTNISLKAAKAIYPVYYFTS